MEERESVWFLFDKRNIDGLFTRMHLAAVTLEGAERLASLRREQEYNERRLVAEYGWRGYSGKEMPESELFSNEFEARVEPLARNFWQGVKAMTEEQGAAIDVKDVPRNFGRMYSIGQYFPDDYLERALDIYARATELKEGEGGF